METLSIFIKNDLNLTKYNISCDITSGNMDVELRE